MPKDVRGKWRVRQTNGADVLMDVNNPNDPNGAQNPDGHFHGGASYTDANGPIQDAKASDTEITFLIPWSNHHTGRYTGRFDEWGRLTGVTFDVANPASFANWVAWEEDGSKEKIFGPYA